jgi:D-alanyl-lipoteichoic acid acyltransferase DltB (MBOAT superfamily)
MANNFARRKENWTRTRGRRTLDISQRYSETRSRSATSGFEGDRHLLGPQNLKTVRSNQVTIAELSVTAIGNPAKFIFIWESVLSIQYSQKSIARYPFFCLIRSQIFCLSLSKYSLNSGFSRSLRHITRASSPVSS